MFKRTDDLPLTNRTDSELRFLDNLMKMLKFPFLLLRFIGNQIEENQRTKLTAMDYVIFSLQLNKRKY